VENVKNGRDRHLSNPSANTGQGITLKAHKVRGKEKKRKERKRTKTIKESKSSNDSKASPMKQYNLP
jgi:hypothetical protein